MMWGFMFLAAFVGICVYSGWKLIAEPESFTVDDLLYGSVEADGLCAVVGDVCEYVFPEDVISADLLYDDIMHKLGVVAEIYLPR